jgi:hypothetical protein
MEDNVGVNRARIAASIILIAAASATVAFAAEPGNAPAECVAQVASSLRALSPALAGRSRKIKPDDRNRIPLGMRCLLVEHDSGLILIDTGAGNKENEKFHDIYGLENAGRDGRTMLEDAIVDAGFTPDDVTLVINSHLHFDHGGGNTFRNEGGEVLPSFPKARLRCEYSSTICRCLQARESLSIHRLIQMNTLAHT